MDIRDRILKEFRELIVEAEKFLGVCGYDRRNRKFQHLPSADDYLRVQTRSLNLIFSACGEQRQHFQALLRLPDTPGAAATFRLPELLGILQAAEADFDRGLLLNLKALVQAEALGDFIAQAETLLDAGYHVPAASLIGAVLEDGLRRLCDLNGITYPPKTKLDSLNSELARAEVYDKLIQKRITALADIRNNADHGHPDKFKPEDVADMLKWVRSFLADRLK